MNVSDDRRRRRSQRLPSHDYSLPGAYFITICIQDRESLLGAIGPEAESVTLSPAGEMVESI